MIEVVWSDLGEPFFGCGLRAYLETEQNGRRCLCGQAAWVPASVLLASRRVLLTSLRSTSTLTMCPCLLCGGALLLRCIAAVVQYFCAAQCAVLLWVSTFVLLSVQCCSATYVVCRVNQTVLCIKQVSMTGSFLLQVCGGVQQHAVLCQKGLEASRQSGDAGGGLTLLRVESERQMKTVHMIAGLQAC